MPLASVGGRCARSNRAALRGHPCPRPRREDGSTAQPPERRRKPGAPVADRLEAVQDVWRADQGCLPDLRQERRTQFWAAQAAQREVQDVDARQPALAVPNPLDCPRRARRRARDGRARQGQRREGSPARAWSPSGAVQMAPRRLPAAGALFDRNGFRQVPRLIDVTATLDRRIVGQELHGDHVDHWRT